MVVQCIICQPSLISFFLRQCLVSTPLRVLRSFVEGNETRPLTEKFPKNDLSHASLKYFYEISKLIDNSKLKFYRRSFKGTKAKSSGPI